MLYHWVFPSLKFRPLCCLETLGTNYPVMQHHMPEQWIHQQHHYEKLKSQAATDFNQHMEQVN
jgi:hypothetical protein